MTLRGGGVLLTVGAQVGLSWGSESPQGQEEPLLGRGDCGVTKKQRGGHQAPRATQRSDCSGRTVDASAVYAESDHSSWPPRDVRWLPATSP